MKPEIQTLTDVSLAIQLCHTRPALRKPSSAKPPPPTRQAPRKHHGEELHAEAHTRLHPVREVLSGSARMGAGRRSILILVLGHEEWSKRRGGLCAVVLSPYLRGRRNTVGNLIEICWLKKAFHGPQFTGTCVKHRGVRFHRVRDVKQHYFSSVPPTSH